MTKYVENHRWKGVAFACVSLPSRSHVPPPFLSYFLYFMFHIQFRDTKSTKIHRKKKNTKFENFLN